MNAPEDADDLSARVDEIHDHLAACLELPVERTESRWLGEAEAVARDVAEGQPSDAVLAERLGHVRDLLCEADETDNERATAHVEEAKAETVAVLAGLKERSGEDRQQ